MTATPEQIRRALRNQQLFNRTTGARIRDAMEHVRNSEKQNPVGQTGLLVTSGGVSNSGGHCYEQD